MSEATLNVIIHGVFTLIGAAITAWATYKASRNANNQSSNNFIQLLIGLIVGGVVGFLVSPYIASPISNILVDSDSDICPFLTEAQIQKLGNIQQIPDAINMAEELAGSRQTTYDEGDVIPKNVIIATDLQSADLNQFPVMPINNQGGWGLFRTEQDFNAPNAGAYWCIK